MKLRVPDYDLADAAEKIQAAISVQHSKMPKHELECCCTECLEWLVSRGELCETLNGIGFGNALQVLREAALAKSLLDTDVRISKLEKELQ